MAKRILFIGHEATRTGAPIILLNFLRWLKANSSEFEFDLLLMRGGPLEDAYREVSNVFVLPEKRISIATRLKRKFGIRPKLITEGFAPFDREYDIVFGNTIVTARYLEFFKQRGFRTICWALELRSIITSFWNEHELRRFARSIDEFIIGSTAVGVALTELDITNTMQIAYPFVSREAENVRNGLAIRKALGIPEQAFVVGGCGVVGFGKGVDLFLEMARALTKVHDDMYFVWVGGKATHPDQTYAEIQRFINQSTPSDRIIFTGVLKDPIDYFASFDVFALTSREEAFGVVCLEAAGQGKPLICFDGSGGAVDFITDDCGYAVPYLDTSAFAEKIVELYSDACLRNSLGQRAFEKARTEFNAEVACNKILKIIEDALKR